MVGVLVAGLRLLLRPGPAVGHRHPHPRPRLAGPGWGLRRARRHRRPPTSSRSPRSTWPGRCRGPRRQERRERHRVDFRGFDTLGEIVVVGVAALGLLQLGVLRPTTGRPRTPTTCCCGSAPGCSGPGDAGARRLAAVARGTTSPAAGSSPRWSPAPVWRSPGCPGSTCASRRSRRWWPAGRCWPCSDRPRPGGRAACCSRRRSPLPVAGYLTTSLVFDLGVFLVVVGLVQAALDHVANRSPVEAGTAVPGRSQHEAEVTR